MATKAEFAKNGFILTSSRRVIDPRTGETYGYQKGLRVAGFLSTNEQAKANKDPRYHELVQVFAESRKDRGIHVEDVRRNRDFNNQWRILQRVNGPKGGIKNKELIPQKIAALDFIDLDDMLSDDDVHDIVSPLSGEAS